MMEFKLDKMCDWERKKAVFLMSVSEDLGYNLTEYGEVAVNSSSGYVYIWSENFNFSLYMPIDCDLVKSDIVALWTDSENGDELTFDLEENTTLEDIEKWADEQSKKYEQ